MPKKRKIILENIEQIPTELKVHLIDNLLLETYNDLYNMKMDSKDHAIELHNILCKGVASLASFIYAIGNDREDVQKYLKQLNKNIEIRTYSLLDHIDQEEAKSQSLH